MKSDHESAAKVVAICNLALVLKYFATIVFQGLRRTRAPEDGFQPSAIKVKEAAQPLAAGKTHKNEFSEEKRWQRIVLNDLENVPIGIVMMWLSLFVSGNPTVTAVCAIGLTLGRCLHTLCYIYKLMPWRAVGWLIGILSTLTLTGNVVYGVFQHPQTCLN
eukprot:468673_1